MKPCCMPLTNGWTANISETDTPPAMCSVAAWPTTKDNQRLTAAEYFQFGEGRIDQRCWSLADIREALIRIASAPPPVA